REIARLYLVELDNPKAAAEFVDDRCDDETRKYVPAAAKPVGKAPELACKELGDWYRGLADQTSAPASKGAMLRRAKAYYERFMSLHKPNDLARAGTTLMLKKIDGALAKLGPVAEDKSGPSSLTLTLGKGITMKLVRIEAGTFMMGSPESEEGHESFESPQHEVTISKPFYMGVTEVTQDQYEAVMGTNSSYSRGPTKPVANVSWGDATDFCRRLSQKTGKAFRLPTEAEWEYACRAGTKTRYSFGDDENALDGYAWHKRNSPAGSQPVGRKRPNAWGLYDMHGNISEWCADWGGEYPTTPATDPQGPASGNRHILRGGSWPEADVNVLRSASRRSGPPGDSRGINIGLRCAMTP
ncbi:MAG: formylglycine-generating enzyme family protein, partial [Planctomycetes bacterium]|nr:formylglycine-generating enzyme family protein [Planctomycetota bacterium]